MSPVSLLVVERDQGLRDTLVNTLGPHGYAVHLAGSGEEACDILRVREIDMVVMGLRLPTMSGQTLFHIIISRWPRLRLRVLVLTGAAEVETHGPWLRLYHLPVLTIPIQPDQLLSLVSNMTVDEPREVNGEYR